MYRGSSPIFDVPEFPTLRRVKPLPKRRRTSSTSDSEGIVGSAPPGTRNILLPPSLEGLQLPGPDATAEELLTHADTLSARMSLQSYYLPMLSGAPDFLSSAGVDGRGTDASAVSRDEHSNGAAPQDDSSIAPTAIDFGMGYGGARVGGGGMSGVASESGLVNAREEEDEHGDGDYIEHLQQPGNTKKRKVPANAFSSPRGHDSTSGHTTGQEESLERDSSTGRSECSMVEVAHPTTNLAMLGQRRGKLTAATLAGLQHKEMLKSRKRQLAAVLGALSHGDTLALDQALSVNYPLTTSGLDGTKNSDPPRVRRSRRRVIRMARLTKLSHKLRHPDQVAFPICKFTFMCPSATSDRLVATKEEVAMLRNRFEAELARQAAKAAKLAAANRLMASLPRKGGRAKRADRAQQRARITGNTNGKSGEQTAEFLDQSLLGVKLRGGKKKKRSALANASNPHHLRNYVPSRLPHATQMNATQASAGSQNLVTPPPLRFLSAEIPPRRRKKATPAQLMSQLTVPTEEWICAFCEYDLFYGDAQDYRRAIRNRKKILRRRRRARERAAAAASGNTTAKGADKSGMMNNEYDAGFEPSPEEFSGAAKQMKWKGEPNKERVGERGELGAYG